MIKGKEVMVECPTITAQIFVGLKNTKTGVIHDMNEVRQICQEYVDTVGLCVTLTGTHYIYSKGEEPGAVVGLINYPRFPCSEEGLKEHALNLASRLRKKLEQKRCSVVMPKETIMLGEEDTVKVSKEVINEIVGVLDLLGRANAMGPGSEMRSAVSKAVVDLAGAINRMH